jgi:hypothetical protein
MDIAFYTYFYGSNSNPAFKIPEIPSLKYKCYYYTNNHTIFDMLKKTKWIPIFDDKPTKDDLLESNMMGKRIKTMPHLYPDIKGYDYLCYFDSKLDKLNENFVENCIKKNFIEKNYALAIRKHWFIHDNVWNEYNQSMKQPRYVMEKDRYRSYINKQIQSGLTETTDAHCTCHILIRNMKHERVNAIGETWYQHIQECGIQDQISFFFVKQLFDDHIKVFTDVPFVEDSTSIVLVVLVILVIIALMTVVY